MIIGLSLNNFREDEQLLVDAAVAEVEVAEEAAEPVVAVVRDQAGAERTIGIVATKLFATPLYEGNNKTIEDYIN